MRSFTMASPYPRRLSNVRLARSTVPTDRTAEHLTDSLFGAVGTTYPEGSDALRGLEPVPANGEADLLTQSTASSLGFDLFERSTVLFTDSKMDKGRGRHAVPETGSNVLMSTSAAAVLAAGVAISRRRRTAIA
jgi:hypothetical protein